MPRSLTSINSDASSEIIGGILIVLIAISISAIIYTQMLPMPTPNSEPNVHLVGYVSEEGTAVIEHIGGETLSSYEIHVTQGEHTYIYQYEDTPWEIGQRYSPPIDTDLFTQEGEIGITVFTVFENNDKKIIFDGVLSEKNQVEGTSSSIGPLLVSSLRTNTPDEDLICYISNFDSDIIAETMIFSWLVNQGPCFQPLALLQMPFDTNSSLSARDYAQNNNGSVIGASWTSAGISGGAYVFNGNENIMFPYCFSGSYAGDFSIEVWIKTLIQSGTIISFDRNNYCELAISDGYIKWSTNAADGITDTIGTKYISDNQWHQVVTTYSIATGLAQIFIDGELDICEEAHSTGEVLGYGDEPIGYIGNGSGSADQEIIFSTSFESQGELDNWKQHNSSEEEEEKTENLFYDTFEFGQWGNWNDGGYDCSLYSGGTYAYQGSYAVHLRDDSVWDSSSYTEPIPADSNGYSQIIIDFWWIAVSMESGEQLKIMYYDGSNSYEIMSIPIGYGQYYNNQFYHTKCYINETDYPFTDQARIVLRCDANSNYDHILFDKVYINVTGEDRIDCDFNLRFHDIVSPHSGSYSLGGTGDFDPEIATFNRSGINIEGYTDIMLNVWYSYKDTESSDYFGLYYQIDTEWISIFEENSPEIEGQKSWNHIEIPIEEELTELILQFRWSSSSSSEFLIIDDLQITGIPISGENNYSGIIDQLTIYDRVLSTSQIFQNYLSIIQNGNTSNIVVADELTLGDIWLCRLTPNNNLTDGDSEVTNVISLVTYPGGDT